MDAPAQLAFLYKLSGPGHSPSGRFFDGDRDKVELEGRLLPTLLVDGLAGLPPTERLLRCHTAITKIQNGQETV